VRRATRDYPRLAPTVAEDRVEVGLEERVVLVLHDLVLAFARLRHLWVVVEALMPWPADAILPHGRALLEQHAPVWRSVVRPRPHDRQPVLAGELKQTLDVRDDVAGFGGLVGRVLRAQGVLHVDTQHRRS